jgi:FecR-like protein
MRTLFACVTVMGAIALAVPAIGQSVISTHSGVVYYFDGSVYLDNQPLESHMGTFPSVPQGAVLRTEQGHAEVLLTPGVFLRMGENSAIRMLSNDLADTRVELQAGSAMVDSSEPTSGTAVTLVFRDWQIQSSEAGTYRVDSDPPRLWVLKGDAEVVTGQKRPVPVAEGMDLPLTATLRPEESSTEPADSLSEWAKGRGDSIATDDTITQKIDNDPISQMPDFQGFTYFPFVGVPYMGMGMYSSPYGSVYPAQPIQPGFYSMYLPGYTYAPSVLLLPSRIGRIAPPPYSVVVPRPGRVPYTVTPTRPIVPVGPITRPVMHPAPAPAHAMPHHAAGAH